MKLCICRLVLGRQTVFHTQSVANCLWKIRKIFCLSAVHATFLQHGKHFQVNAWWISANTHMKQQVTNTELANHRCRICQIALLQWCEWDIYQIKSRTFGHPQVKFSGHWDTYFKNEMNGNPSFPAHAVAALANQCLCVQFHDVRCLSGNQ